MRSEGFFMSMKSQVTLAGIEPANFRFVEQHLNHCANAVPYINPLNAELNPICHFPALLRGHPILHVSRIRVKCIVTLYPVMFFLPSVQVKTLIVQQLIHR